MIDSVDWSNIMSIEIRVRIVLTLFGAIILGNIIAFGLGVHKALTLHQSFDYVEGFVMYFATDWSQLFSPINTEPFVVSNYPPTYYLITGTVNEIVGDIFVATRLISILAVLGSGALVARMVHIYDSESRTSVAVVSGLLVVSSPYVTSSGIIAKPDALAMFFSVAVVYWYLSRDGNVQVVGCWLLSFLTLWTKQNFLAGPIAVFLMYVLYEDIKKGLVYGVSLAAAGLGLLAALAVATNGQAWLHLVEYPQDIYLLSKLLKDYYWFMARHGVLIAISVVAVFVYGDRLPRVTVAYVVIGAVTGLLVSKRGASVVYFFESIAAMSLITGLTMVHVLPPKPVKSIINSRNKNELRTLLVVLLALSVAFAVFAAPPNKPLPGAGEAAETLDKAEGPVVTWDPGVAVAAGQPLIYQSADMKKLHERLGVWNQTGFVASISEQRYTHIVLRGPANASSFGFTAEQLEAVSEKYKLKKTAGSYYIYIPKK